MRGEFPDAQTVVAQSEECLKEAFLDAERIERAVFSRIQAAFRAERISPRHFSGSTGYGYGDEGRDAFERLFARAVGAEAALTRPGIASGTHALTIALFGILRPGQTLLYASGAPYDTLHGVIGISEKHAGDMGSLRDFGIKYKQLDLLPDCQIDLENLRAILRSDPSIGLVALQRSRGYSLRSALSLSQIEEAAAIVHAVRPELTVMVDNCYGEFVRDEEPCSRGADLIVGSMIKNPGGGFAPTGGYLAGKADIVEKCAYRTTAPGLGGEIGSWSGGYLPYFQGLYLAPHTVCQALKGAMLFGKAFSLVGFEVNPLPDSPRDDIIQAVCLNSRENLIAFCCAIQAASPVDAYVVPEPWAMPGYDDEVIMAAGTFIAGASIELSADAPLRPPFVVYLQGGLVYEQCRMAAVETLQALQSPPVYSLA